MLIVVPSLMLSTYLGSRIWYLEFSKLVWTRIPDPDKCFPVKLIRKNYSKLYTHLNLRSRMEEPLPKWRNFGHQPCRHSQRLLMTTTSKYQLTPARSSNAVNTTNFTRKIKASLSCLDTWEWTFLHYHKILNKDLASSQLLILRLLAQKITIFL